MAASPPAAPGRIFISYRREETAYPAGWLFDRLAEHFGSGQVFKDVDSIELGDDFVEVITTAVGSCDVLLALIGDQWLTITDEHGRRRLDNPDDFVRLEIEAALVRKVRVIPILVDGARMPRADELPDSLARLVRRQALELSPNRFDFDTSRLVKVLDRTLADVQAEPAAEPVSPRLALSTTVVDFGRLPPHRPSPERRVRLGNAGGGILNAETTTEAGWLQLRRVGDEVVMAVDTTTMGEHEGIVTVDSDGGSGTIHVLARIDPALSPVISATTAPDLGVAADKGPQEAAGEVAPNQLAATPGASLARHPRGAQDRPRGPESLLTPSAPVLPREKRPGRLRVPKWLGKPPLIISAAAVVVIMVIVALIVLAQTHNPNVATTGQTQNPNVATVTVEALPADVAVGEGAVWVANNQHGSVSRIDPATRKVTTIKVGQTPAGVAVGNGAIWVANNGDDTVSRIDPATDRVKATIPVEALPAGVAVGEGAVWVVSNGPTPGIVSRIDPATNRVVARIPVESRPQNVAVGAGYVWVANGGHEGSRIDPASNRVVAGFTAFLQTGPPSGVAVGARYVWVANTGDNTVSRINPANGPQLGSLIDTIPVGQRPQGVAVGAGGVWVANSGDNTVSRINPTSHRVVATIEVGQRPRGVAVGAGAVWVANDGDDTVSRIDPATGEVTTIKVGPRP
jgi:YVTN family beta-propeller protein